MTLVEGAIYLNSLMIKLFVSPQKCSHLSLSTELGQIRTIPLGKYPTSHFSFKTSSCRPFKQFPWKVASPNLLQLSSYPPQKGIFHTLPF